MDTLLTRPDTPVADPAMTGAPVSATDGDYFCPVVETMRLLEQKWTLQIVKELVGGKRRFCQLQHALRGDARTGSARDVNPKTLSQRLKTLEAHGVVTRRMVSDIPPNVEYDLTCSGHDLVSIVDSVDRWARRWMQPTGCCAEACAAGDGEQGHE